MKKPTNEREKFDQVMGGLLAVPHAEVQAAITSEKRDKAEKKEPRRVSVPSSSARKRKAD